MQFNFHLNKLNPFNNCIWQSLLVRQKVLTWFAVTMLALAVLAAVIAGIDERLIRGANL